MAWILGASLHGKRPRSGHTMPACRELGEDARLGHNRTRPPPFMGWRGPCATCRTRLASCPAHPAATAAPPGPDTRAIHRFPGSSHVPGLPPSGARFRRWKHFYALAQPRRKGSKPIIESFFRCPQSGGGYPQSNAVIHRIIHRLSTGRVPFTGRGDGCSRAGWPGEAAGGRQPRGRDGGLLLPPGNAVGRPGVKISGSATTRENTSGVFSRLW